MSHEKIETNIGWMALLIAVVISFGGLAEIVPLMYQAETVKPLPGVTPYPALQLAGRAATVIAGADQQCIGQHQALRNRRVKRAVQKIFHGAAECARVLCHYQ